MSVYKPKKKLTVTQMMLIAVAVIIVIITVVAIVKNQIAQSPANNPPIIQPTMPEGDGKDTNSSGVSDKFALIDDLEQVTDAAVLTHLARVKTAPANYGLSLSETDALKIGGAFKTVNTTELTNPEARAYNVLLTYEGTLKLMIHFYFKDGKLVSELSSGESNMLQQYIDGDESFVVGVDIYGTYILSEKHTKEYISKAMYLEEQGITDFPDALSDSEDYELYKEFAAVIAERAIGQ